MCKWILVQICWFRSSVECSESVKILSDCSEILRNERIGLSTFRCGAVCCQRSSDGEAVMTSIASMKRQIRALGYGIQDQRWFLFILYFKARDKFVHSYSRSSGTFRTCPVKLMDFSRFLLLQNQEFWKFWFLPTFFLNFGPGWFLPSNNRCFCGCS